MHTLFDFITHVKGIEYLLSLTFIAGYLIFWETLKPKPFSTVVQAGKEDMDHLKTSGSALKSVGRLAAAPFIGLAYIVLLPIGFFMALTAGAVNVTAKALAGMAGKNASFEWRPMEAYFEGRKKKKEAAGKDARK